MIPSKTDCFFTIYAGAMISEVYPDQLFRSLIDKQTLPDCFFTIHAGAMISEVYPDQLFRSLIDKQTLHQKTILILGVEAHLSNGQLTKSTISWHSKDKQQREKKPLPPVINYKWKQQYFPSFSLKTNSLYRSSSTRRRFPFQTFTNLSISIFILICYRKTSNCKACPNHMVNLNFTQKVLFIPIFPFLLSQSL